MRDVVSVVRADDHRPFGLAFDRIDQTGVEAAHHAGKPLGIVEGRRTSQRITENAAVDTLADQIEDLWPCRVEGNVLDLPGLAQLRLRVAVPDPKPRLELAHRLRGVIAKGQFGPIFLEQVILDPANNRIRRAAGHGQVPDDVIVVGLPA